MNPIIKYLLVGILVLNAIFWGLAPHRIHCQFVARMGLKKCPSHTIHILTGLICFIGAILIAQHKYIMGSHKSH